ncbi:MAG: helix-turn-helix transcriptional regulator [Calditrichia bacterium]
MNTYIHLNIKTLRNGANFSQTKFGKLLSKAKETIASYESGRAEPNIQSLLILSDYFQISIDDLIRADISKWEEIPTIGEGGKILMISPPQPKTKAFSAEAERGLHVRLIEQMERRIKELEHIIRQNCPQVADKLGI